MRRPTLRRSQTRTTTLAAIAASALASLAGASALAAGYGHIGFPAHCAGPVYKPRSITARCADNSVTVTGISWRRYGGNEARGHGTERVTSGGGAGTKTQTFSVDLTLSRVIYCDPPGRYEYLRLTLTPTGPSAAKRAGRFSDRYPCVLHGSR